MLLVRKSLYWTGLSFLLGTLVYGFVLHPNILLNAWTASGQVRFLLFAAGYALTVLVIYVFAPTRLPLILVGLGCLATCGAVGIAGPAATALFLLSATVLGKALLFREDALAEPVDMLLAALVGCCVYMTVTGLTAALPIHYPAVHVLALALPIVVWPKVLRDCLEFLAHLLGKQQWAGTGDYVGFALAAFIPLVHLVSVLLPQVNGDAVVGHLAIPSVMANEHAWTFDIRRYVYAAMPMGVSWTILPGYLLGGEYAARLTNFSFYLATALLLFTVARRYLSVGAAWLIVAVYASTPFFQAETGNIYAENLWSALLFGGAVSLDLFWKTEKRRYFLASSVLASASLAVKILGAFVAALILGLGALKCRHRPLLLAAGFAISVVCALYPYVIAFMLTGNPLFPFANDVFQSPYFRPAAFTGLSRNTLLSPYEITFSTHQIADGGGGDGSLGFAYLILFPFSLLTLQLLYPFIGWTSLFAAVVLSISEFQLAELNLRYLYPALPFGMIVVAVAYANVRELSRPLFRALCGVGVGVVLLNAYAMPTSGWAHRDFPLWMVLTRGGIEQYRDWGAPERRLIDYLNLTRGRTVRVAFFSRPMLVDLKGDGVFTNWYNYEISTKLEAAGTPAAVFDLMKEQHITHFIAFKPDSGNQNVSGAVEMFLRTYTEPVFSAGDAYLAQLQPEYRFSNETVVNGDFEHGAEGWTQVGVPPANVRPGTVSVSTEGGYRQYISIDDRVVYRYSLTASCDSADTRLRLQILWLDQAGRELGSSLTVQTCGPTRQTFTVDLEPPAGANGGQILLLGLDVNRPAEISKASLKW